MDFEKFLINFPVYQLVGDKLQQQNCLQYLGTELHNHMLSSTVISTDLEVDIYSILQAVRHYDLVLLTNPVDIPVKKIRLGTSKSADPGTLIWPDPKNRKSPVFLDNLRGDLTKSLRENPVWACVLIGGKSSRMGQPKHLLRDREGRTWLEKIVKSIDPLVSGIVFSGQGEIPISLKNIPRLPDIPGVVGPLNGILSAGRWQPYISWILIACDMPEVSHSGIEWLLADRLPGSWGRVPRLEATGYSEPLFAWYDFRAVSIFEKQLLEGNFRIGSIAQHEKIENPTIPDLLGHNWRNVNTPEQLHTLNS